MSERKKRLRKELPLHVYNELMSKAANFDSLNSAYTLLSKQKNIEVERLSIKSAALEESKKMLEKELAKSQTYGTVWMSFYFTLVVCIILMSVL